MCWILRSIERNCDGNILVTSWQQWPCLIHLSTHDLRIQFVVFQNITGCERRSQFIPAWERLWEDPHSHVVLFSPSLWPTTATYNGMCLLHVYIKIILEYVGSIMHARASSLVVQDCRVCCFISFNFWSDVTCSVLVSHACLCTPHVHVDLRPNSQLDTEQAWLLLIKFLEYHYRRFVVTMKLNILLHGPSGVANSCMITLKILCIYWFF